MKKLILTSWLCFSAIPVFAAPNVCSSVTCVHSAPAPLIGLGLPVALVVGGVMLGAKLLKRWR